MIEKAYKYRFYPDEEQKSFLAKTFGCCRFVYNHFLHTKSSLWKEKKESLNYGNCSSLLKKLKEEFLWLKEISSVCLQQVLRHLDRAYENFFKKRTQYPQFKSKYWKQSSHYMKNAFTWKNGKITLAKMKNALDIRWSRSFKGEPTSLVVSKDTSGKYFISIHVKENIQPHPFVKKEIAIDLGLTTYTTNQQGKGNINPRFSKIHQKRVKRVQQSLCRKTKGSNNRKKTRSKLAHLHQKIRDKRYDFLHKLSSKVVNENQVIVSEDLNVKEMQKNHRLAFSIGDASWGTFLNMLRYKSEWYGRDFVQVDRFFPSSKLCSCCGKKMEKMPLHIRNWVCSSCQTVNHRDENAAKNLLKEGMKILNCTAGHAGSYKPVESV